MQCPLQNEGKVTKVRGKHESIDHSYLITFLYIWSYDAKINGTGNRQGNYHMSVVVRIQRCEGHA